MERAGAALAAIDSQGRPPDPDFVRTPRTGVNYAQQVLVLFGDEVRPAGWTARPARPPRRAQRLDRHAAAATRRAVLSGVVRRRRRRRSVRVRPSSSASRRSRSVAGTPAARAGPSELETRIARPDRRAGAARRRRTELELRRRARRAVRRARPRRPPGAAGLAPRALTGCRALDRRGFRAARRATAPGIDLADLRAGGGRGRRARPAIAAAQHRARAAGTERHGAAPRCRRRRARHREAVPAAAGNTPRGPRAPARPGRAALARRRRMRRRRSSTAPGAGRAGPARRAATARASGACSASTSRSCRRSRLTAPAEVARVGRRRARR